MTLVHLTLAAVLLFVLWALVVAVVVGLAAYGVLYLVSLIVPTLDEPSRRRLSAIVAGLAGLIYLLSHLS